MTDFPDLGALRSINEADVYKAGVLAGHLRRAGDVVEFAYTDSYLAEAAVPPVAFTLPKVAGRYRATGGSVPPFFAGLLPEGLRLSAITTAARTSEDDHLSLLLAVGTDTIGDVRVVPAGSRPADPVPMFDRANTSEADFGSLFSQATSADADGFDRTGLPGVQVKVSAQMISTPVATNRGPAILKLNPPDHPFLVENENFFLDMAAGCGILVPRHQLAADCRGRTALFVDRFDRVVERGGVRKLAQEDACQVSGRYPAAKYRISLQEAMKALADAVAAGGGSYPVAIVRMLEIAAFSYLIGNGDLHGKNLSIRQNPDGLWEVTPAYDLLTTQPYLSWNDPMALPLYGRDGRLTHRWWIEAAHRLGVAERAVKRGLARIVDAAEPYVGRVSDIGFDEKSTHRLRQMINQRREELRSPAT
ncbi:type II toxin-antitoxin system HipA family toxin [Nocardia sp. alder85J]|uniref:type II toxin-antitoxin system HipA family toxin n=1 Tax=Nocardia sp. alder85J TaxID=2862949 RepID=UPI001CD6C4B8|nr:type II toxin-antitoxin system HipA family toxin [Nocardia sp. alder85J]MCX4095297.1 type II toxin-antitoxin system HipA family toxin [Nocardia sp. alder85J]